MPAAGTRLSENCALAQPHSAWAHHGHGLHWWAHHGSHHTHRPHRSHASHTRHPCRQKLTGTPTSANKQASAPFKLSRQRSISAACVAHQPSGGPIIPFPATMGTLPLPMGPIIGIAPGPWAVSSINRNLQTQWPLSGLHALASHHPHLRAHHSLAS